MLQTVDGLRKLANDAEADARQIVDPVAQSEFIDFAMKLRWLAGEAAKIYSDSQAVTRDCVEFPKERLNPPFVVNIVENV